MRGVYLRNSRDRDSGCRGGVSAADSAEYELEIGQQCNADTRMLALCTLVDELWEYLPTSGAIGRLLYDSWKQKQAEIEARLATDAKELREYREMQNRQDCEG